MKGLRRVPLILAVVLFLGSVGSLLYGYLMREKDRQNLEKLTEVVEVGARVNKGAQPFGWLARLIGTRALAGEIEPTPADTNYEIDVAPILPQYRALHQRNSDIVGWLKIEGTLVDYPIMQSIEDAEFYLHRNFDKEDSYSGLPFLDGRCDVGRPTDNLLIYGHHMKNGTMFGQLPRYKSKSFYLKYNTIQFDLLGEARMYEIVGVFLSKQYEEGEAGFRYYEYTDLSDIDRFNEYIEQVTKASLYNTGISADWGDNLLTLSTCNYHVKNGTFVIVARHRP